MLVTLGSQVGKIFNFKWEGLIERTFTYRLEGGKGVKAMRISREKVSPKENSKYKGLETGASQVCLKNSKEGHMTGTE